MRWPRQKLQTILRENEAIARQSKELATIVTQTPVTLKLDECQAGQYDRNRVSELFRELEFVSLLPKLPQTEGETPVEAKPPQGDYHIVNTIPALDKLL